MNKLQNFIQECIRVFRVTKKPTKEEYKNIALVSAAGILVIGLIGAIMTVLRETLGMGYVAIISLIVIIVLMYMTKND